MLLVGYVHNDAAKRGMNKWLWTAIVLFVPNAIGFILYLLTRKQLLIDCANCGYLIQPNFRFCPKCASARLAACGHCNTPIQPGDLYCNNCGRILHEPMK
jgi:RNA polymerase subunit RPABC4/transcription elongation factor Spt4